MLALRKCHSSSSERKRLKWRAIRVELEARNVESGSVRGWSVVLIDTIPQKTLPIFRFSRVSSSPSFNRPDYMVADGGAEKRLTGPRCYPVGIHDGVGESDVVVVSSSFPISYSSRRNRPEVP